MKKSTLCFIGLALISVGANLFAQAIYTSQSIRANAEIFGAGNAGLPDGSGTAPPVFALPPNPAVLTMLSVTGLITLNSGGGYNDPDGVITSGGYYGPIINGASGYTVATTYGGISGISIPGGGALMAVFEPATEPTGSAPASLDFAMIGSNFSPTGNPPALPEDSRSLTAPGVVCEGVFREPLKVYERDRPCKRMRV